MTSDKAAVNPVAWPNGEIRLWDSQWMNCVNHDNRYYGWDQEEAIAHAVNMAERYMRENYEKSDHASAQLGRVGERRCHCCGESFECCRDTYRGTISSAAPGGDVEQRARELLAERCSRYSTGPHYNMIWDPSSGNYVEYHQALEAIIAALSVPKQADANWSRHDRIEFALRDAGFSPGEAAEMTARIEAPQPVEAEGREPYGWMHEIEWVDGWSAPRFVHQSEKPKPYLETVPHPDIVRRTFKGERFTPLYTTPPLEQPAIDLEQFRPAVEYWIKDSTPDGVRRMKANRLLALIDGAKAWP